MSSYSNGPSALQITTPQLPNATLAGTYSVPLQATGGTVPYSWTLISGGLPSGMALSTSGTISALRKLPDVLLFRSGEDVADILQLGTSGSMSVRRAGCGD